MLKYVIFADDTNIFFSGENLQQLLLVVTAEMTKLKQLFNINKLSINLNKTRFMIFESYKIPVDIQVKITIALYITAQLKDGNSGVIV